MTSFVKDSLPSRVILELTRPIKKSCFCRQFCRLDRAVCFVRTVVVRGKRGKFFRVGNIIFPDFFPQREMLFPGRKFPFGRPKINFNGFQKWKERGKKTKKKKPLLILELFLLPFPPCLFNFPSFLLHFPFFPCLSFPDRSAEISWSEVLGVTLPPPGNVFTTSSARSLFDVNFLLDYWIIDVWLKL